MKQLQKLFLAGHWLVIALFFACAIALVVLAATELWHGLLSGPMPVRARFDSILECIGMLTIGLVALELAQTIFEEEVQRDVKVSGPTRVRRYLSRFLVVIVIALCIETLVAVFELMHSDPAKLPYAGAIGASAALLLVAWGLFVHFNRSAEELEPEAMAQAKREDRKVK
ncbi:MAG: hypothetical protein EOO78_34940 [Oxalobacteraceae bacterium]|nr:MAG: hypothetical protein EOO78_34940 [Oxalobacteraceae bacterium]